MFNSLGRVIHIASLSVSVSQGIGQMIMYVDTHLFQALQDEYEDDDITVSDEELLALQLVTKSTDKYKPELIKTIYKLPLLRVTL